MTQIFFLRVPSCNFVANFLVISWQANLSSPALSKEDLTIYLEILQDAVNDWKPGESHQLTVVFPKSYQEAVENTLKNKCQ